MRIAILLLATLLLAGICLPVFAHEVPAPGLRPFAGATFAGEAVVGASYEFSLVRGHKDNLTVSLEGGLAATGELSQWDITNLRGGPTGSVQFYLGQSNLGIGLGWSPSTALYWRINPVVITF